MPEAMKLIPDGETLSAIVAATDEIYERCVHESLRDGHVTRELLPSSVVAAADCSTFNVLNDENHLFVSEEVAPHLVVAVAARQAVLDRVTLRVVATVDTDTHDGRGTAAIETRLAANVLELLDGEPER